MKLVTFRKKTGEERAGWLKDQGVVDMHAVSGGRLPVDMLTFIDHNESYFQLIDEYGYRDLPATDLFENIRLLAPLPNPRSFRDYIGFEMHMLNASKTFGHTIGKEWYEMPIFYFTNHHGIFGPDDEIERPAGETRMDIELELAIIIGKRGKDIKAADADDYIFGYTIFNDWTARAIQAREMKIPLGPHKGKDFANAIGPCIVTREEMEQYRETDGKFDLSMKARINGKTICDGNYNTVYYSFPQMIERAAENNVTLMPGDILGSGTVGWGSLIENNFEMHRPLEPGDVVELEIEGIGVLRNTVV